MCFLRNEALSYNSPSLEGRGLAISFFPPP